MRDASEDELDALMARLADGDREAFDPLFRALHPRALRVARARLDPEEASDAAQASLVTMFSRASEFESGRPVLPWFYAVVSNEVRRSTRGSRRRVGTNVATERLASIAAEGDPESVLAKRELHRALERAVAELDAPSANAIAALLGEGAPPLIAPEALRKRVSRAYARLRVLLGGAR